MYPNWDESIERPYFVREDGLFPTPGMVELALPYFKKGDDFADYLHEHDDDVSNALRSWSKDLKNAADKLWCTADILDEAKKNGTDDIFYAQAGTHHASISGLKEYWMETLSDLECHGPEEKKKYIEALGEYFKDMQFLLEEPARDI
ncbi:uncharacterized protein SPPG_07166 [Spizellomyces punctatus DAOM BR117]|uniref:Uncharacterized protein n=1 Tax=Spizellomyces punctatus (strain DAOM BR117) TaxID=645134 RepID=A0A0L0H9Y0_SPIPD|nr:uncharacterized protein SPPG_07166 [Spizellomyces punctatus DAOM BR117]KNC97704.1 hypothetical protein SPPG_07166 [Spizellomyces punctatus DAOM BR117]|eukprot:XP_016605744.1 hypothetical protein SPPG_07166 [Spizellomyces punctatus DAOM BR117]